MKIKICGLMEKEDILAVNKEKPDYAGFVFAESKRKISEEKAWEFRQLLDKNIPAVGVFVNEDPERIIKLAEKKIIQIIQLHGEESAEDIQYLKKTNLPIIKAVRVQTKEQIEQADLLPCDYLLLDTYVKSMHGGSGKSFDRSMIPKLNKPFFLAGGIGIDNMEQAVKESHPYCIDISSAAETNGKKDADKIKELVQLARRIK